MTRFYTICLAVVCTFGLINCKTKDKVTTEHDTSIRRFTWNNQRLQRSMFTVSDTLDVYQFSDIGKMLTSTNGEDTTATVGNLKYRFIRHLNGLATDTVSDTIKSHIHNEVTKNSITSKTQPKDTYNGKQYAVFYVTLVLVLLIVFWVKR